MTKLVKKIGIDISKSTFDVNYVNSNGKEISICCEYTSKGINKFIDSISDDYHCVMEATGVYHQRLAYALRNSNILVSIINPLVIKNFSRTLMVRTKTDAKDAVLIRKYAETMPDIPIWDKKDEYYDELQQIYNYIESLEKQKIMLSNQLEAINHRHNKSHLVEKRIKSLILKIEKDIDDMTNQIEDIIQTNLPQQTKNLRSIPGIGKKSSAMLLIATNGFESFDNHRQLSSYFGLCPRLYNSGTSIKSKGHICKMGLSWARKILYMCALSASQYNQTCKKIYQRLIQKGKNARVALIAVANKLLKIAFAVVKNDQLFNINYNLKYTN